MRPVPPGWTVRTVLIRPNGVPDVSNAMKAACIGEFSFKREITCTHEDSEFPEECPWCGGRDTIVEEIQVPWTTCKNIYKAMVLEASREASAHKRSKQCQPIKPETPIA
mgnify:CR=1 FL=1